MNFNFIFSKIVILMLVLKNILVNLLNIIEVESKIIV